MGERLVFNVYRGTSKDDSLRRLCALHFHWSAYASSVYREADMLIKGLRKFGYNKDMDDHEAIQVILNTIGDNVSEFTTMKGEYRHTHGGVCETDIDLMKQEGYTWDDEHVNRAQGLIAISEEAINSFHNWAEDIEEFHIDEECYTNTMIECLDLDDARNKRHDLDIHLLPEYYIPDKCDPFFPTFDNTPIILDMIQQCSKDGIGIVLCRHNIDGKIYYECLNFE